MAKNEKLPQINLSLIHKKSLSYENQYGHFLSKLFYHLIVEDLVDFIILKNFTHQNGLPFNNKKYIKFFKGNSWSECNAQKQPVFLTLINEHYRTAFDLLRKKCVLAKYVDNNDASHNLLKNKNYWFLKKRNNSSDKVIARTAKTSKQSAVQDLIKSLIGEVWRHKTITTADNFSDFYLLAALKKGGKIRHAAIKLISSRIKFDRTKPIPKLHIKRKISKELTEELVKNFKTDVQNSLSNTRIAPYLRSIIAGTSSKTADLIYPTLIEILYKPFIASEPYGPWYYGSHWKLQVSEKDPKLLEQYKNRNIPHFASANSFITASALALKLGRPYAELFYKEFREHIHNLNLNNSPPTYHTIILGQSETDINNILNKLLSKKMSRNRCNIIKVLIKVSQISPQALTNIPAHCAP